MTQRVIRLGLAALCAGLTGVVAAEISLAAFEAAAPELAEKKTPVALEMPELPDIDAMVSEILERPLFSSTRAPFDQVVEAEDEEEGEEEQPAQPQARLTGMMIGPEGREALFERDGKPIAVKEGAEIDGRTVKTISSDQVVLVNADGEEVRKLIIAPPASPARPPQRVAASGNGAPHPQAQAGKAGVRRPANGAPKAPPPQAATARQQAKK